jgi:hypothetical protein
MNKTIVALLQRLQRFGSSIEMSWAEEDGEVWLVSWVTSGKRFTATDADLGKALFTVWSDAAAWRGSQQGATS